MAGKNRLAGSMPGFEDKSGSRVRGGAGLSIIAEGSVWGFLPCRIGVAKYAARPANSKSGRM